jgi:carbon monoxide dehydrogenase subunit G
MKRLALGVAELLAMAGTAWALDVTEKIEIKAAPDKVWAAIGDFCGIANWHPVVAKCEAGEDGGVKMRTLTTKDGGVLKEALTNWDDQAMSYTYTIMESPLPVAKYVSTIKVSGTGDASTIEWSSTFNAKDAPDDKAKEVISGIYKAGLESLMKKF